MSHAQLIGSSSIVWLGLMQIFEGLSLLVLSLNHGWRTPCCTPSRHVRLTVEAYRPIASRMNELWVTTDVRGVAAGDENGKRQHIRKQFQKPISRHHGPVC